MKLKSIKGRFPVKEKKKEAHVFGVDIGDLCERENSKVPKIGKDTVEYLRKHAMHVEGIFRIPGSAKQINQLRQMYDAGEPDPINSVPPKEVHAVAGVLKLYLRELPEPLLTHSLYAELIAQQRKEDLCSRLLGIKDTIAKLPKHNFLFLRYLTKFLVEVCEDSESNKMTTSNVAIVFGPNLVQPKNQDGLAMIQDTSLVNGIVRALLEEFDYILNGAEAPGFILNEEMESKESQRNFSMNGNSTNYDETRERLSTGRKQKSIMDSSGEIDASALSEPAKIVIKREIGEKPRYLVLEKPAEHAFTTIFYLSYDPLTSITQRMNTWRKTRKIMDETMTKEQLREERRRLRHELREYEKTFRRKFGMRPTRSDKAKLKPIFKRYREVCSRLRISNIPITSQHANLVGERTLTLKIRPKTSRCRTSRSNSRSLRKKKPHTPRGNSPSKNPHKSGHHSHRKRSRQRKDEARTERSPQRLTAQRRSRKRKLSTDLSRNTTNLSRRDRNKLRTTLPPSTARSNPPRKSTDAVAVKGT